MPENDFMSLALAEAEKAAARGDVPVGAVLVQNGQVLASASNIVDTQKDPCGHAEILVIRAAAQILRTPKLEECDIYVTLEPCAMCAGAMAWARIRRVYFGAYDPKSGGVEHGACVFEHSTCHHRPEVYGGIQEAAAQKLMKNFFEKLRNASAN